ncbi:MAG: tRNA-dihydrouridine synthase [Myxococcota bacterium]
MLPAVRLHGDGRRHVGEGPRAVRLLRPEGDPGRVEPPDVGRERGADLGPRDGERPVAGDADALGGRDVGAGAAGPARDGAGLVRRDQPADGDGGRVVDAREHVEGRPLLGPGGSPSRLTGVQPISAVAFEEDSPGFEVPRPATAAELEEIVVAFRDAAVRAVGAGFRGVELHGAHGYLLGQFLSRLNTRTDGWGGDPAGRTRLIREVARAVRAAVPDAVVGVRLSPEDGGNARGLDLDESVAAAAALADDGVDYVHLSLWDHRRPTRKRPEQHPVPLFRAALPAEVALLAAGDVWTAEEARWLHDQGADAVVVGRAAIVDPDWPRHVVAEGREPVRGPRTPEQLAEVAVSPAFAAYLRRFRNLVA